MVGGGWRPVAKAWLQLTGGVASLLAFDHACQAACAAAGIRFPPALIGDLLHTPTSLAPSSVC